MKKMLRRFRFLVLVMFLLTGDILNAVNLPKIKIFVGGRISYESQNADWAFKEIKIETRTLVQLLNEYTLTVPGKIKLKNKKIELVFRCVTSEGSEPKHFGMQVYAINGDEREMVRNYVVLEKGTAEVTIICNEEKLWERDSIRGCLVFNLAQKS